MFSDPRKIFDSTKEDLCNVSHDNDDDKYRRRPAMDWLNRWLRYFSYFTLKFLIGCLTHSAIQEN